MFKFVAIIGSSFLTGAGIFAMMNYGYEWHEMRKLHRHFMLHIKIPLKRESLNGCVNKKVLIAGTLQSVVSNLLKKPTDPNEVVVHVVQGVKNYYVNGDCRLREIDEVAEFGRKLICICSNKDELYVDIDEHTEALSRSLFFDLFTDSKEPRSTYCETYSEDCLNWFMRLLNRVYGDGYRKVECKIMSGTKLFVFGTLTATFTGYRIEASFITTLNLMELDWKLVGMKASMRNRIFYSWIFSTFWLTLTSHLILRRS